MELRRNPDTDGAAQARALLAAVARRAKELESASTQAFFRLAALTGILVRHQGLTESDDPDAPAAAALDAATVCREARAVLRSLSARSKRPVVVTVVVQPAAAPPSPN